MALAMLVLGVLKILGLKYSTKIKAHHFIFLFFGVLCLSVVADSLPGIVSILDKHK